MKGQIQLGESIFVVFIVIMLIVFGIVFYAQANQESIEAETEEFEDLETIIIAQYATSLTELKCSLQEIQYPNCFDRTKLDAFVAVINNPDPNDPNNLLVDEKYAQFYFSQLGNARLHIQEVYPQNTVEWTIYNNDRSIEGGSVFANQALQAQANLPVSIYDPITNSYAFGIMEITEYR